MSWLSGVGQLLQIWIKFTFKNKKIHPNANELAVIHEWANLQCYFSIIRIRLTDMQSNQQFDWF